jgi:hypothetical protein
MYPLFACEGSGRQPVGSQVFDSNKQKAAAVILLGIGSGGRFVLTILDAHHASP